MESHPAYFLLYGNMYTKTRVVKKKFQKKTVLLFVRLRESQNFGPARVRGSGASRSGGRPIMFFEDQGGSAPMAGGVGQGDIAAGRKAGYGSPLRKAWDHVAINRSSWSRVTMTQVRGVRK
jgi:hypothetical protein